MMTVRTQTADEQFFDATWAAQEHFTLKAGGQPLDERTWLGNVLVMAKRGLVVAGYWPKGAW